MIILLILNFRSDISKNKTFSTTKKAIYQLLFCIQHIKLGFICFYPIFFNLFPSKFLC